MDKVFAALKSDVRRQILVYLSTGDLTLKQVGSRFPFSGPAILYHLRMLEDAHFIERRGYRYALMRENVRDAFNLFLRNLDPHAQRPTNEHSGAGEVIDGTLGLGSSVPAT